MRLKWVLTLFSAFVSLSLFGAGPHDTAPAAATAPGASGNPFACADGIKEKPPLYLVPVHTDLGAESARNILTGRASKGDLFALFGDQMLKRLREDRLSSTRSIDSRDVSALRDAVETVTRLEIKNWKKSTVSEMEMSAANKAMLTNILAMHDAGIFTTKKAFLEAFQDEEMVKAFNSVKDQFKEGTSAGSLARFIERQVIPNRHSEEKLREAINAFAEAGKIFNETDAFIEIQKSMGKAVLSRSTASKKPGFPLAETSAYLEKPTEEKVLTAYRAKIQEYADTLAARSLGSLYCAAAATNKPVAVALDWDRMKGANGFEARVLRLAKEHGIKVERRDAMRFHITDHQGGQGLYVVEPDDGKTFKAPEVVNPAIDAEKVNRKDNGGNPFGKDPAPRVPTREEVEALLKPGAFPDLPKKMTDAEWKGVKKIWAEALKKGGNAPAVQGNILREALIREHDRD